MRLLAVLLVAAVAYPSHGLRPQVDKPLDVHSSKVDYPVSLLQMDGASLMTASAGLSAGVSAVNDFVVEVVKQQSTPPSDKAATDTTSAQGSTPPYLIEGLQRVSAGLWLMVESLVDSKYQQSLPFEALRGRWAMASQNMPDISAEIKRFRQIGDTAPLANAVMTIIDSAISSDPGALVTNFLQALNDIVQGMGKAWLSHGGGELQLSIQSIWEGLRKALKAVDPDSTLAEKQLATKIDFSISQVNAKVLAFKRKVIATKVCWKRTRLPPKFHPSKCQPGWTFDGASHCNPAPNSSVDCFLHCKKAGMCSSYCGEGRACCKPGDEQTLACKGSTGADSSMMHHQCVEPGPAVAFYIKDAGEAMTLGYWLQAEDVNSRPSYYHDTHLGLGVKMEWSTRAEEWQIVKMTAAPEKKRIVLYQSEMNSPGFPTHAWTEGASSTPPTIISAAEGAFSGDHALRLPADVMVAECEPGFERHDLWCVAPCPSGFVKKVGTCEQTCGTEIGFPTDGQAAGICGTDPSEMQFATVSMTGMAANRHTSMNEVSQHMADDSLDVDVQSLEATFESFMTQSEKFPHPLCEFVDEAPQ